MDQESQRAVENVTLFLAGKVDEDAERVLTLMKELVCDAFGANPLPDDEISAAILTNAAAVLINAADRLSDIDGLQVGEAWMTAVMECGQLAKSRFESAALYNLANSRIGIADLNLGRATSTSDSTNRVDLSVQSRFDDRDRLRLARRDLAHAASLTANERDRGMRLCNLANTLDHSGRWIEAYDAYVRALEADPGNGNAAGNAAVLIQKVIRAGWDFEGHLCSLYDHYLTMAHANREGTVDVAGEDAARRFDAMQVVGSPRMALSQSDADPYRAWVAHHRLALVAALEGLGTSDDVRRWDTIGIRSVADGSASTVPPAIFNILNVLKADYLVARRLAYEADTIIQETGCATQHRDDPGVYTETFENAIYGEVSAKLTLAHRAALDVLDKTAVAVNEHLGVGDDPRKVSFRKFWFEDKSCTALRSSLVRHDGLATAILTMAELAIDMAPDSLYGHAQDVRNAGTHRFVLVHHGTANVETTSTMQAMTLGGMRTTCHQSLAVARAAFLYLISLIDVYESRQQGSRNAVPLYLPNAF